MRVEVYRWVASRIEIVLIDNTDAGLGIEHRRRGLSMPSHWNPNDPNDPVLVRHRRRLAKRIYSHLMGRATARSGVASRCPIL
jgi:hypothetical protein